jgi:A/G-specific adenine glycosylase
MARNVSYVTDARNLVEWYRGIRRELPWRKDRDPYRIWISEIMLQQTTVAAVVPYYERFLKRFPTLEALAIAPVDDVLEYWAGLGYYSRARNLHRASQALSASGFPRTAAELIELPGFGPYTARAVSSLAFDEKTGVLDGNVIRVLSRMYGFAVEYWKPAGRAQLQEIADRLAQIDHPADLNQGMMELGATVCTPVNPSCLLCPWSAKCVARAEGRIDELPLKKPRKELEIWLWRPTVAIRRGRVWVEPNTYTPFLRSHDLPPGDVKRLKKAPKSFSFRGSVTHHDIFVDVVRDAKLDVSKRKGRWVPLSELKKSIPVSLIRKAIEFAQTAPKGSLDADV